MPTIDFNGEPLPGCWTLDMSVRPGKPTTLRARGTVWTKEQWSGILRALADVKGRRAKVADIDGDVLVRDVGVSMSASVTGAADVSIDMEAAW